MHRVKLTELIVGGIMGYCIGVLGMLRLVKKGYFKKW